MRTQTDTIPNPPRHAPYGRQLLALLGLSLLCMVGIGLISAAVPGLKAQSPGALRCSQGLFLACSFLLPVLIWTRAMGLPTRLLGLRTPMPWWSIILFGILAASWMFFPEAYAGYLNARIEMPDWVLDIERIAGRILRSMLQGDTFPLLLANLLVVALLPALCEEIFFRAALQGLLQRWTGSKHAAVWIAAFLFSLIHLQFLGFLPRWIAGVVLGYLYAYSGTIWPSVVAHFANNATVVIWVFMAGYDAYDDPSQHDAIAEHWYVVPISIALLAALFTHLLRYAARFHTQTDVPAG